MTTSSKRPEHLAWACLVLTLVFFGIAFLLGRWSGYAAASAVAWQILASALIWLVLAIQFHQRSRAEQEKLDMSQLAKDKQSATIFQGQGEQAVLLAAAQRRLDVLERWFLPVFAALIAIYEIGIGLYALGGAAAPGNAQTQQPLVTAVVMAAVAFLSFLMSRYATGMSAEPRWKPLRAGGSYLLGAALLSFAVALSLAGVHFQFLLPIRIVGFVVPVLLIVLGLETALNIVLDVYRPRLKGQYSRAAFDSRLLGLINEPGGVFRSVAAAIDYQFGFQVSQTWFYKLLEKAIVPLIFLSAATLYLASCIVVIAPNEEAIVERFGNPLTAGGQARTIGPGLHLKLPWPIDIAYTHPVKRVMELYVGYVPHVDPKTGEQVPERSLLWGDTHYAEEHTVLVASEQAAEDLGEGAAPVSLVNANIPIQYRINNLYHYTYNHDEPDKLLEAICYRELTRLAASATVEVRSGGGDISQDRENLFGAGRARARQVLAERIQKAADDRGLGIELAFVGVQGIHPPPEVAPDYQGVIGAIQRKQALVLTAEAERNRALSSLIGSVRKAHELADWARQYQEAREAGDADRIESLGQQLDQAFASARGEIFRILREAQSYAFEKATLAEATGERFASQVKAYEAAPNIYVHEQRLAALEEALKGVRKYVVAADANDTQVTIINLEESATPNLMDIGGLSENSGL